MRYLGCAHPQRHLRLTAIAPERLAAVTRVTATPAALLVPAQVAPETDQPGFFHPRRHQTLSIDVQSLL